MGEVIRRSAAKEAIFEDIATTLTNAKARGGNVAVRADERLATVAGLIDSVTPQRQSVEVELGKAEAQLEVRDGEADDTVGAVADEYWNAIGRPATDPVYSTIVPGGIATYTKGDVEEQPTAMELFATLLESGIETRVPGDKLAGWATQVRGGADKIQETLSVALPLRTKLKVFNGVEKALARAGQKQLVQLKRQLIVDGMSEADIHTIIPNRPRTVTVPVAPPQEQPVA